MDAQREPFWGRSSAEEMQRLCGIPWPVGGGASPGVEMSSSLVSLPEITHAHVLQDFFLNAKAGPFG